MRNGVGVQAFARYFCSLPRINRHVTRFVFIGCRDRSARDLSTKTNCAKHVSDSAPLIVSTPLSRGTPNYKWSGRKPFRPLNITATNLEVLTAPQMVRTVWEAYQRGSCAIISELSTLRIAANNLLETFVHSIA